MCESGYRSGLCPAGWPEDVPPPHTPEWEHGATAFLFDCCPPSARDHRLLRRHPLILARFTLAFLDGYSRALEDSLSRLRAGLAGEVSAELAEAAVSVWQEERARVMRRQRESALILDALRGKVFRPRL